MKRLQLKTSVGLGFIYAKDLGSSYYANKEELKKQNVELRNKLRELVERIYLFCNYCTIRKGNSCKGYDPKRTPPSTRDYRGCEFKEMIKEYKFKFRGRD